MHSRDQALDGRLTRPSLPVLERVLFLVYLYVCVCQLAQKNEKILLIRNSNKKLK